MISLTRLNNKSFMVNSDLIKFVEQAPDTIVTLITGEKIVVRETSEEVLALVIAYRRTVLRGLPLFWDPSSSHASSSASSPGPPPSAGPEQER